MTRNDFMLRAAASMCANPVYHDGDSMDLIRIGLDANNLADEMAGYVEFDSGDVEFEIHEVRKSLSKMTETLDEIRKSIDGLDNE